MVGLFVFSYINFELIFSLKYWTLSLKIESLMQKEEQMSAQKNRNISILFWTLEFLLVAGFILQVTSVYIGLNDYLITVVSVIALGICFACIVFIADAFRRLVKCLEHDKLGISKFQMSVHVVSYSLSLLAVLFLFLSIYIHWNIVQDGITKKEADIKFESVTLSSGISALFVAVSAAPICFIMN